MTDNRQAVERLLRSLDTCWIKHLQTVRERRAADAGYKRECKRLGISTKPFDPQDGE